MIDPVTGIVRRPVAPTRYVIYFEKRGDYAELNIATSIWHFTPAARFATPFVSQQLAEAALVEIARDCGDLWHLTREDLRVLEKP